MADLHRQEAPEAPSCPYCGLNDRVDRDTIGRHDNKRGAFLCGRCWSAFTGSPGEWAQHQGDRDTWRKRHGS